MLYVSSIGYVGLLIELGIFCLFNKCKLLIINFENVVFPAPNSPFNNNTSPALRSLQNFKARDSVSERSKIWFSRVSKLIYAIPLRASTKSVFSHVKCPLLLGSLPKCP